MLIDEIKKYLASRSLAGPWRIEGCSESGFIGAVVIPALAESATLFATLHSLSQNPADMLSRFLIVVVVNNREDAPDSDKIDNLATLELLSDGYAELMPLRLAWVDAASPGRELPIRGGGVGLARKIGLDLVLDRLDHSSNPLLSCLDADTLVRPDYLQALTHHFEQNSGGGAVIPFRHQPAETTEGQRAILRYELFLRAYVLGLSMAGSPYGFHTVGSAMACRASAYVKIGGMNNRMAAEDFYFLQQLSRTVGICQLKGTVVYPSPRASHRVPFGTGRSVSRFLDGESEAILFYRTECFQILGEWLSLVSSHWDMLGSVLLARAGEISFHLAEYLNMIRFVEIWGKLKRNNRSRTTVLAAFNGWFDGLKTMKLIHHLSAITFPRCEPEPAMPDLLKWAGLKAEGRLEGQLELLRRIQLVDDYESRSYMVWISSEIKGTDADSNNNSSL